ncbi:MAG: phosphoglycerate mutase family protein [bacterium]|nr:phosphoglycerate mutase family protein [bacterium]
MFKRICKITFISHGATIYSTAGIINDNLKSPKLNDVGEEEIVKVCEYLTNREVHYDKIYTGPEAYCIQTAQQIAKLFHQKPVMTELQSRKHGDWQGSTLADLYKEYKSSIISATPPNGETLKTFNRRVSVIINRLIKENKGNRIIIVTTPEVIQSVLAKTLDLATENQHKILIKTGTLTQISYFEGWSSVIYTGFSPL